MAIESSKVAAGMTILADHFNKLWNDVFANHDHDGSNQGHKVDHKNQDETGNMGSMTHRHEDIEIHFRGGGPGGNSIDNPGGERGVHGLPSAAYVAGSYHESATDGLIIQGGTATLSSGTVNVTFPTTFTAVIAITGTLIGGKSGDNYPSDLYLTNVSVTGFTMNHSSSSFYNNSFYWIAVGTKT